MLFNKVLIFNLEIFFTFLKLLSGHTSMATPEKLFENSLILIVLLPIAGS
ncbi:Uncharacterised protein [Providencia stuartii]|nr:Uncharacterised protein [Providencia stuartii]